MFDSCSPNNDIEVHQSAYRNGINSNIFGYKTKRCRFQLDFFPTDKVVSSVTKRMYDCVTSPETMYLNCYRSNVIYLISCCRRSL